MSRLVKHDWYTFLFLALVYAGCSGAGSPIASSPDPQGQPLTDLQQAERSSSHTHLWGLYEIHIDPVAGKVFAVPLRQAEFTVNVVNFLNMKADSMGFKINSIKTEPAWTDIDIDVSLKHPFPGMPQYNGYDVRGVFMGDGSATLAYNSDLVFAVLGTDQYMLPDPVDGFGGPDGYTRWFNRIEFSTGGMPLFSYTKGKLASPGFAGTATLNPYRSYADTLGANEDLWQWLKANPAKRGVFSSGVTNTRNYYLRFPSGKGITYGYAVIADWKGVQPNEHPANAAESVACSVVNNSTVYYVSPSEKGGNLKLDLSLWNWDAKLDDGTMEEYRIIIESTVLSSPYYAAPADMTPIAGGEHFSTYRFDIPADNVSGLLNQEFWVIVEEKDFDYSNDFGVSNLAENDPLAAFFRYPLSILDYSPDCPVPEPTAIQPSSKPNNAAYELTVTSTNLMGTTGLAVYLDKTGAIDGSYNIQGTGIHNVNLSAGTFDATFNLAGASPGKYYVIVTNSCGETGASKEPLFTIKEYLEGDIYVSNHPDFAGLPEEGTMQHPFHTITKGVNAAKTNAITNDLILVDYGTGKYPEALYWNPSEGYMTVRAYNWYSPEGRPLIGGKEVTTGNETIGFFHAWNVTIQGFKITFIGSGAGWWQMMDIIHSHNIVIKDCYFTGDSPGTDWNLAEAIGFHWSYDTTITNCLFKNINAPTVASDTYVQVKGIDSGWSRNLTISNCEFTLFQTNPVPPGKSLYITPIDVVFDYGNFVVRNNLIHHITLKPGSDSDYVSFRAIENVWPLDNGDPNTGKGYIFNNTIDSIDLTGAPNSNNVTVYGIYNLNYDYPGYNIDIHSNIVTNIIGLSKQNIIGIDDMNVTDYTDIWHVLRGSTEYPWANPAHQGVGCIFSDPMFVNNTSAPYNYTLKPGSPCIGTGKNGKDMGCYGNLGPDDVIGLLGPED